jgi:hypothetical protein
MLVKFFEATQHNIAEDCHLQFKNCVKKEVLFINEIRFFSGI